MSEVAKTEYASYLRASEREELLSLGSDRLADLILQLTAQDQSLYSRMRRVMAPAAERDQAGGRSADEPHMVGASQPMRRVYDTIRKFAHTDAPVLIVGESGTGKELAALAIHERSSYAQGPFVPINCGGLPSTLIVSELFGHEKGSFTGAYQRKVGRIEAAQGGTVFLDEIGDLPLELQPHLLRFLQEKTIDRVGGQKPIPLDVRVIAATNADLTKAMQEGRFREDLFFRLNVLTLRMPALRDRGQDIDVLSKFFVRKFAEEIGRPTPRFDDHAARAMRSHAWPGNVRELVSCVRRAVIVSEGDHIAAEDLGLGEAGESTRCNGSAGVVAQAVPPLKQALGELEATLVRKALHLKRQNVKRAAEQLGVSRVTLYRLMEKHGIQPEGDNLH